MAAHQPKTVSETALYGAKTSLDLDQLLKSLAGQAIYTYQKEAAILDFIIQQQALKAIEAYLKGVQQEEKQTEKQETFVDVVAKVILVKKVDGPEVLNTDEARKRLDALIAYSDGLEESAIAEEAILAELEASPSALDALINRPPVVLTDVELQELVKAAPLDLILNQLSFTLPQQETKIVNEQTEEQVEQIVLPSAPLPPFLQEEQKEEIEEVFTDYLLTQQLQNDIEEQTQILEQEQKVAEKGFDRVVVNIAGTVAASIALQELQYQAPQLADEIKPQQERIFQQHMQYRGYFDRYEERHQAKTADLTELLDLLLKLKSNDQQAKKSSIYHSYSDSRRPAIQAKVQINSEDIIRDFMIALQQKQSRSSSPNPTSLLFRPEGFKVRKKEEEKDAYAYHSPLSTKLKLPGTRSN